MPKIAARNELAEREKLRRKYETFQRLSEKLDVENDRARRNHCSFDELRRQNLWLQELLAAKTSMLSETRRTQKELWENNEFNELAHTVRKKLFNGEIRTELRNKNLKMLPQVKEIQLKINSLQTA